MNDARQPNVDVEASIRKAVGKKPARWGLESPDELIGSRINDRYTIVERIGRGGMGTVFKAIQAPMGRTCAVKVLSASYDGKKDPAFDKRFFREAATVSRLRHPNTVTVYDYGNIGDLYFMAMEYIDGHTLHAEIHGRGPISERRTRHIAKQICRSLQEAHSHGVVHRDLKPDNVLIVDRDNEKDLVKVFDFGLAKVTEGELADEDVTETGLCMGSPKHMAPEQITGDVVSAHTDIYALGIMMYEMLTAHSPFDRPTRYQTLVAQVHEQPRPFREVVPKQSISGEMESIVMRCLRKERHRRFASMNHVLESLSACERSARRAMSSMPATTPVEAPRLRPARRAAQPGVRPATPPSTPPSGPPPGQPRSLSPSPDAAASNGQDRGSLASIAAPESAPSRMSLDADAAPTPSRRSLSPASPVPAPPRTSTRRHSVLLAGVFVLALVAVVVAFGAWHHRAETTRALRASCAMSGLSATLAPPAGSPTSTRAAGHAVRIETEPAGAKVFADGKRVCERTPCEGSFEEAEHAGSTAHRELRFVLPGYQTARRALDPTQGAIHVILVPAGRGSNARVGGSSDEDLSDDTGYKFSPY